jgi:hypothetical protein
MAKMRRRAAGMPPAPVVALALAVLLTPTDSTHMLREQGTAAGMNALFGAVGGTGRKLGRPAQQQHDATHAGPPEPLKPTLRHTERYANQVHPSTKCTAPHEWVRWAEDGGVGSFAGACHTASVQAGGDGDGDGDGDAGDRNGGGSGAAKYSADGRNTHRSTPSADAGAEAAGSGWGSTVNQQVKEANVTALFGTRIGSAELRDWQLDYRGGEHGASISARTKTTSETSTRADLAFMAKEISRTCAPASMDLEFEGCSLPRFFESHKVCQMISNTLLIRVCPPLAVARSHVSFAGRTFLSQDFFLVDL